MRHQPRLEFGSEATHHLDGMPHFQHTPLPLAYMGTLCTAGMLLFEAQKNSVEMASAFCRCHLDNGQLVCNVQKDQYLLSGTPLLVTMLDL